MTISATRGATITVANEYTSGLPVTVLTGFLGAGKTTLLRQVLEHAAPVRVGVIMNEIGVGGTDGIKAAEQSFLELTSGCVCCTRNPDLIAGLKDMRARGDLDRVVIETTGLADPLALTFTLERPDVREFVRLDCVVTVFDCANYARVREVVEWQAQVRAADIVVLAKEDLVSAGDVEDLLEEIRLLNPAARVVRQAFHPVDSVLLDTFPHRSPHARAHAPAQHSTFAAISVALREPEFELIRLEDWLSSLPAEIFRAKGIVRSDEGWTRFHVVGGRLQVEVGVPPPAHAESRMIFLGQGLDEGQIKEELLALRRT